jgi:hypothetical protein
LFLIGDRHRELIRSADSAHWRWNSNFSKPFQGKSKLFQGNSKLFQAFSKEFQTFSLAVSNEIKALSPAPGDFAFFTSARGNSPRLAAAPGERRAAAERSAAADA